MDLSDSSKLLKTYNLSKALESLSCNEDTNAADSIFSKLTTCDASDQSLYLNSISGESLFSSFEASFEPDFFTKHEHKEIKGLKKPVYNLLKPFKKF